MSEREIEEELLANWGREGQPPGSGEIEPTLTRRGLRETLGGGWSSGASFGRFVKRGVPPPGGWMGSSRHRPLGTKRGVGPGRNRAGDPTGRSAGSGQVPACRSER